MTFHLTQSGSIELYAVWGHGTPRPNDLATRDNVIISHDNDGHYTAWTFEGAARDAALKIAEFLQAHNERSGETYLLTFDGYEIDWVDRDDWADGVEVQRYVNDGALIRCDYYPGKHDNGLCVI